MSAPNMRFQRPTPVWRRRAHGRLVALAATGAAALAVTACGSGDEAANGGETTASGAAAFSQPADPATGAPVKLGVLAIKGEPEFEEGVEAAVDYLNERGGGFDGHRVELEVCETDTTPQAGIACANEFAHAGVAAAVLGRDYSADAAFPIYERAGIPALQPVVSTNQGLVSPISVALGPGIPGVLSAFAGYVKDTLRGDQVVTVSGPAPKPVQDFVDAPLNAAGIDNSWAFFSPQNPDFTSTFTAAVARDPDAIMSNIDDNAKCVPAFNALRTAGTTVKVFQIHCSDDSVVEAAGALADGQLFYAPLDSVAGVDSPDAELFGQIMDRYSESKSTGYSAAIGLSSVMTLAAVLDKAAPANVDPRSVLEAFRGSRGVDIFMGPPLECGEVRTYPGLCTASMRIFTVEDGEKKSVTGYISSPQYLG